MSKIIIPLKNFCNIIYDSNSGLSSPIKPEMKKYLREHSPFSGENNQYVIQPSWPQKRTYKESVYKLYSSVIKAFNINPKSTLIVNLDNSFEKFELEKKDWSSWSMSNDDEHDSKRDMIFPVQNLIINAKTSKIDLNNMDRDPSALKTIEINSNSSHIHLDHMPNLKSIKITSIPNTTIDETNHCLCFKIDHCFGIESIDLSQFKAPINYLFFSQINPNCKITFNPQATLFIQSSRNDLPISQEYFDYYELSDCHIGQQYQTPEMRVLSQYDKNGKQGKEYENEPRVSIQEIVGPEYIKNGIVQISAKDFALKMVEFERKLYNKFFDTYSKFIDKQLTQSQIKQPKAKSLEKNKTK